MSIPRRADLSRPVVSRLGVSRFAISRPGRRLVLAALGLAALRPRLAHADDPPPPLKPEQKLRPRQGDTLVFVNGPTARQPVTLGTLPEGGPPAMAWAVDPATGLARSGSRLNQVLLVRLPPASLAEASQEHAAQGVVAYSAICTHAQCLVTEWNKDRALFQCPCHNSAYDPRDNAAVVQGPATRALAALPLAARDGALVVAEPFIGKVGAAPA